MPKKYHAIGYGGTFGPLHDGHKYAIRHAAAVADVVHIGITSDGLAKFKSPSVPPLNERKKALEDYLRTIEGNFVVTVIYNPYGEAPSSKELEAIIATSGTLDAVREISRMRKLNGLPELKVEKLDYLLAEDGERISSTRIRRGEITPSGKLVSAMR
ncbi:MAG: pantetheine-phosphate adenylyltransferase [Nanoarchaeota archaeon]|nr:pantetheine-phosphate adenylyltransferase [Nanoarchaeota archaeon]